MSPFVTLALIVIIGAAQARGVRILISFPKGSQPYKAAMTLGTQSFVTRLTPNAC
jgi:hypothetical protein